MFRREDCALRPFREKDLETVLRWRTSDRIVRVLFSDDPVTWEGHRAWFKTVSADPTCRYWIFYFQERPMGLSNFTRIDAASGSAEWGFYRGETDGPRGLGTCMGFLSLEFAFGELNLRSVSVNTFLFNAEALHLERKLGFEETGDPYRRIQKQGRMAEVVSLRLTPEQWRKRSECLAQDLFGVATKQQSETVQIKEGAGR